MPDVFVSYSREDRARVQAIAQALEARGFTLWWDRALLPGQEYSAEIEQALETCKAVVVVWSQNSTGRPWVQDEARKGLERVMLVPVRLDDVTPPLGFREARIADLSGWPREGGGEFEQVVAAVQALAGPGAGARADPAPRKAPRRWRALAIIAIAALTGLGVAAVMRTVEPGPQATSPAPSPAENAENEQNEQNKASTDEPGAPDYGMTAQEYASLPPQGLIRLALERTTIEKIEAEAKAGDRRGQALLCLGYDANEGVAGDARAARQWCEAAAGQGDALARYMLGLYHRQGAAGFKRDVAKGNALILRAAEAGDARAQFALGADHLNASNGLPEDNARALLFLGQAADQGHQDAQFNLAWMYEHGRGVARDYNAALVWYRKLAAEGSAVGVRAVGWMYLNGFGVDRDYAVALDHLTRASAMGDGNASALLGGLYERGEGVPGDRQEAIALYRKASEQGFEAAREDLARLGAGD